MARWRLRDKHYLNVPGTEWEYKESEMISNRQKRVVLGVPLYLDPEMAADWNYPNMIVVADKYNPAFPDDIVFVGQPTPDMAPLDDEAQEITDDFVRRGAWIHPIDSINMTYSQSILSEIESQMVKGVVDKIQVQAPNVSAGQVTQKQFDDLQSLVKQLMDQNAALQAQILERPKTVRRA